MRRLGAAAAIAAAAAVLVAGCSGSGSGGQAHPVVPHTSRTPDPTTAPTSQPSKASATVLPWHLPQPLGREVVDVTGDGHTVVVAGGLIAGDGSTASAFELDTATGKQTTLPDLAVPVHDAAGVTLGGHPLVVGGGNATEQSVVQRLAGGRWRVVGHLPGARSDLVTVATGTGLLVIGGYDGVTSPPALLASPDGTHFTVAAQLPQPVRYPAVTTCDGSVWVLGGESNGAMITPIQRIAGAGTAHVTAQVVAHLRTGLGHAMAVCVGGRVLLMGGRTGQDTVTTRMWWFDPSSSSLSPAGQLPHGLADAGVLGTPSAAYLIGGETPGLSDRVMRVTWR